MARHPAHHQQPDPQEQARTNDTRGALGDRLPPPRILIRELRLPTTPSACKDDTRRRQRRIPALTA
ncbi:hypothetical protein ACQUJS_20315 [Ralstonia pseudosolanacearum]|uniref:Uncharacterized protein n=1 Tax=Ralstonia solanacearum TaxID=305 RepID=A0A0S4TPK1_RALSL|nr:hypothetical protein [Ralstonia pseudosolanacearum]QCX51976.1 hypothetical protein E7Z57_23720 [Ralstonia pseudosolanacearum]CUV11916.1 conserved protein of unknown function [Ralstonia solanacearum]